MSVVFSSKHVIWWLICCIRQHNVKIFYCFCQGRGIETNLYAQFKCDSLKIGMVIDSFVVILLLFSRI